VAENLRQIEKEQTRDKSKLDSAPGAGTAATGLFLGSLAFVFSFIPFFGWFIAALLALFGIVFSGFALVRALKTKRGQGKAIAGILTSVLALLWMPLFGILIIPTIIFIHPPLQPGIMALPVKVKPANEGATILKVPVLAEADAEGNLQLEIKGVGSPGPSGWWQNLELFIDDHPRNESNPLNQGSTKILDLPLLPGEHEVVLKKNGIEVYRGKVEVKKPSEGKIFASIPLEVTGTVVITSPLPVGAGVVAFVKVDGSNDKEWPVGTNTIEVPAEVGQRLIEVVTTKPVSRVVAMFEAKIEPGKKFEYKIR
jgi:hypothetical protein